MRKLKIFKAIIFSCCIKSCFKNFDKCVVFIIFEYLFVEFPIFNVCVWGLTFFKGKLLSFPFFMGEIYESLKNY